jgi:hypothetical protein
VRKARAVRSAHGPFEIALTSSGKAGVIYTDDTLTKDASGNPLPQIVLAQQQ